MEAHQLDFAVEYFGIRDSTADPQQEAAASHVSARIEAAVPRKIYEGLLGEGLPTNDKHLMIFNDQSGSMSGTPFNLLKEACLGITDMIFDQNGAPLFHTDVVFYGSDIASHARVGSKGEYEKAINGARCGGMTNFCCCFDLIKSTLLSAKDNSECYILFFTDGQDTCSGANLDPALAALQQFLKEQATDARNI